MTENEVIEFMKRYLDTDCYTDKCVNAHNIAINALEETQQYHAIGTVEECRAAVERQKPKKVNLRHIRKYDGYDDGECPCCGTSVSRDYGTGAYCPGCGQKLDWGDEE